MFIVYDFIILLFTLVYLPVYLLRGKFHAGFLQRFGILPKDLKLDQPIWIHAVSVGEAISIKKLVEELRKAYPQKQLVISTVTATGNKIAQGLVREGDFLTYLPLDFSFIIRVVLKKINPSLFIIAETEIWPNLICALDRQKIPVVTVNGRISDSSYTGYRAIKLFLRPILNKITYFCVQSEQDAVRLRDLGVKQDKIQVTGNVKFDLSLSPASGAVAGTYRQKIFVSANDKLLVCGSTHPGEEKLILEVYQGLLIAFPNLKLLIAPRHPERSRDIGEMILQRGFAPVFISGIASACPSCLSKPVFILDVIGQLFNFYAAADIVFMGGSLVKKGGHNILEPASLKKPIIFGPHMFNFRNIAGLFLENKAVFMVEDSRGLIDKIKLILGNEALAEDLGEKAFTLIASNSGATERNIKVIKNLELF